MDSDSSYYLVQVIGGGGNGGSAIVYKAITKKCSIFAVKSIALKDIQPEAAKNAEYPPLLSHPNLLIPYCCYATDRALWVVMPFMNAGSLKSIISHGDFTSGLQETVIAVALKETLKALSYLHGKGHFHRDIKAGNILVDKDGSVKLSDLGVSKSIYASSDSSSNSKPYWVAPEVVDSDIDYSLKADIWSFGITALELAHGRPPLSYFPTSKSMVLKINKRSRFFNFEMYNKGDHKSFSHTFKDMVASCLDQDPSNRPTAENLLKHQFFNECQVGSESNFLLKNLLRGIPSVDQRTKESKLLDEITKDPENGSDEESFVPLRQIDEQLEIVGWNLNAERLELDPVFQTDLENKST